MNTPDIEMLIWGGPSEASGDSEGELTKSPPQAKILKTILDRDYSPLGPFV